MLKEYYVKYLQEIRGLSKSTVNHYLNALNVISKYLREKWHLEGAIYDITEIDDLKIAREFLYQDLDFIEKDRKGHQMYSAGLNNYCRFAIGEGLNNKGKESNIFDCITPKGTIIEVTIKKWRRSSIMKWQSIQMANFKCEVSPNHKTFIAKINNQPYMEGHHVIPISMQSDYENNLDVHANIMCLCPICHRLLHYGKDDERVKLLNHIYDERHRRLEYCGIEVGKKDFVESIIAV